MASGRADRHSRRIGGLFLRRPAVARAVASHGVGVALAGSLAVQKGKRCARWRVGRERPAVAALDRGARDSYWYHNDTKCRPCARNRIPGEYRASPSAVHGSRCVRPRSVRAFGRSEDSRCGAASISGLPPYRDASRPESHAAGNSSAERLSSSPSPTTTSGICGPSRSGAPTFRSLLPRLPGWLCSTECPRWIATFLLFPLIRIRLPRLRGPPSLCAPGRKAPPRPVPGERVGFSGVFLFERQEAGFRSPIRV